MELAGRIVLKFCVEPQNQQAVARRACVEIYETSGQKFFFLSYFDSPLRVYPDYLSRVRRRGRACFRTGRTHDTK